jgi:hypothetical protein
MEKYIVAIYPTGKDQTKEIQNALNDTRVKGVQFMPGTINISGTIATNKTIRGGKDETS